MAKITYIHEGESEGTARIVIDSENIDSTNFVNLVDSNIHAIQWDGTSGEIEYKDNRPNAIISDISSYGFETVFANEKQAIANAEAEAEAQAPAETYEDKRSREFPRIEDQLDDIYHNGLEGWKSTIKAIKDKYPKE
jgi:hypothetical protein